MQRRWIRHLMVLVVLLLVTHSVSGESLDTKLTQKIDRYDSEKTSSMDQLIEIAQRFQIPMGVEWREEPDDSVKPIHLTNTTVKDAIHRILERQSGYSFVVANEVVQVSPAGFLSDPRDFLNLNFANYSVQDKNLSEASYWLRILIKRTLHPERNAGGGYGGVQKQGEGSDPRVTFSMSNVTVRQILNKLVAAQGNSLWLVRVNPAQLMSDEPFYAQGGSGMGTGAGSDFVWMFLPLIRRQD